MGLSMELSEQFTCFLCYKNRGYDSSFSTYCSWTHVSDTPVLSRYVSRRFGVKRSPFLGQINRSKIMYRVHVLLWLPNKGSNAAWAVREAPFHPGIQVTLFCSLQLEAICCTVPSCRLLTPFPTHSTGAVLSRMCGGEKRRRYKALAYTSKTLFKHMKISLRWLLFWKPILAPTFLLFTLQFSTPNMHCYNGREVP